MRSELNFSVNLEGPVAVYMQIENQVQFAIASGKAKPGDTLPSVREVSDQLHVNPNTVTKAYRELELLQLVRTRRGVGVTVTERAPQIARARMGPVVRERIRDAVAECISCGLSPEEIRALVLAALASGVQPYEGRKG